MTSMTPFLDAHPPHYLCLNRFSSDCRRHQHKCRQPATHALDYSVGGIMHRSLIKSITSRSHHCSWSTPNITSLTPFPWHRQRPLNVLQTHSNNIRSLLRWRLTMSSIPPLDTQSEVLYAWSLITSRSWRRCSWSTLVDTFFDISWHCRRIANTPSLDVPSYLVCFSMLYLWLNMDICNKFWSQYSVFWVCYNASKPAIL